MPVTITPQVAPSARMIVLRFRDGTSADTILQSIATAPVVTSGGSPVTLGTPIWGANDSGAGPGSGGAPYLPWAAYPVIGGPISNPGSTLLSASSGAFTTAAGVSPALAAAVCDNLAGGTLLPPFDPATPVMRQGWNLGPPGIDTDAFPYKCNAATRIQAWAGAATLTPNGYPASFTSQGYASASVFNCPTNGVDGKGRPNCPLSGTWTVKVTTPTSGAVSLAADGPGDTCTPGPITTSGPDTVWTFNIVGGGVLNSPNVQVATTVIGDCNLRIYRPGVPTDGSLVFDPAWLDIAAGASCLRTVTAIDFGGGGNVGEWADFRPATHLSDDMPTKTVGGTIASISPGTDPTGWIGAQVPITVTFTAPHGINSGMLIPFSIAGSFATTLGNPIAIYGLQWARRVSATEIMVAGQFTGAGPYSFTLAQTYTNPGTWTCNKDIKPGRAPADVIAQCNANHSDLWMPTPCGLSDDGCQQLFTLIASDLHPDLKFRCEAMNEHWNDQFGSYTYCQNLSYSLGKGTTEAYVIRSGQVYAMAAAAFAAAGRPNDVVCVLGTQAANANLTVDLLRLAATHGLPSNLVIAGAPYIDDGVFAGPPEPTLLAVAASLDDDQRADMAELFAMTGGWERLIAPHKAAIAASAYPSAKLVAYEWGLQYGPPFGATQVSLTGNPKVVHCSMGYSRHPRARGVILYLMQMCQANGMDEINVFQLHGRTEGYFDSLGANWTVIPALGVVPGRGDGSDGLANNLTIGPSGLPWEDYRPGHLVSVYAGALAYWRSLLPGGTPTPTPTPTSTLCPVLFTRAA